MSIFEEAKRLNDLNKIDTNKKVEELEKVIENLNERLEYLEALVLMKF